MVGPGIQEKPGKVGPGILSLGRQRQAGSWGLLAGQASLE